MKVNKQMLYQLKSDRAEALKAAESALDEGRMEDHEAAMAKVKDFNGRIEQVEKVLDGAGALRRPGAPGGRYAPRGAGIRADRL